jgi:hypothetical protein
VQDVDVTGAPPLVRERRTGEASASTIKRDAFVSGLALAAGVGAAVLVLGSDREPTPTWASAGLALLVGWAYIGSGLVAWRQRREHRLGPVMVFIGFAWFATFLADAEDPLPFTLGTALEDIYLLGFVYLVLSFPSGRLRGRVDRVLIASAIALTTIVEVAWLLFADSPAVICSDCPENVLQVVRNDGLAEGILQGQRVAGLALSLFTAALLVNRWRRASAPQRRRSRATAARSRSRLPTTASVAPAGAVGRDCAASPTAWRRSADG